MQWKCYQKRITLIVARVRRNHRSRVRQLNPSQELYGGKIN